MSESNKPKDLNPYPRGAAGSSVPVLFSLRNVQPLIVGSGSKEAASQSTRGSLKTQGDTAIKDVVSKDAVSSILPELQSQATPAASNVVPPMAGTKSAQASRISNRVYNTTIAFLVLILAVLVFRNSSSNSHDKLAKSEPVAPVESTTTSIPASLASTTSDASPFKLAPSNPQSGLAKSDPISNPESSPIETKIETSPISNSPILLEPSSEVVAASEPESPNSFTLTPASQESSTQAQTTAKPAYSPNLLEVSGPTSLPAAPKNEESPLALEFPTASSADVAPPQSISNTSSAGRAESPAPQTLDATNRATPGNQIFDTGVPLTTRDLIALHRTNAANADPQMQGSPAVAQSAMQPSAQPIAPMQNTNPAFNQPRTPYVPTFPVSGPTSVPTSAPASGPINPQVLSGQSYPPLSKELNPLTIPAYEQNALNSRNGMTLQNANASSLKQPAGNNSNRYQGYLIQQPSNATQPMPTSGAPAAPYIPIGPAPTQSGNSVGYPPSN